MSDLLVALKRLNYDDRAEKLGSRNRDKATAALDGIGHRSNDSRILRWGLTNLPKATIQ